MEPLPHLTVGDALEQRPEVLGGDPERRLRVVEVDASHEVGSLDRVLLAHRSSIADEAQFPPVCCAV
ncbi:hypothetical protein GCM10010471_30330 [Leucobacter komagatae]